VISALNLSCVLNNSLCQQFGGCQTKTLYTPLKNKASNKANKQQRDRELQAVLNKPLPKITSITNNIVSFDHSPQQFKVGDLVYGVWLIKLITATAYCIDISRNNGMIKRRAPLVIN
jgi:hypothetical protein